MATTFNSGVPDKTSLLDALYGRVDQYYAQKIRAHGPTPMGVDWPCALTQKLRFVQLLKVCQHGEPFTLNDLGCGYGALLGFLRARYGHRRIHYCGIDLCAEMIDSARSLWQKDPYSTFAIGRRAPDKANYSVASGIFNVRLNESAAMWTTFVKETVNQMMADSSVGIAVNFLAPLSPDAIAKPELYRPSPDEWVQYCEQELGATVEVVSNYGMQEFTLLVRHSR